MKIVIGCVDGHHYSSREFSDEELQEALDEVKGQVGRGDWNDISVDTSDEFIELLTSLLKYDSTNSTQTFAMEMTGGNTRNFNVCHIVWWEIKH